MPKLQTNPTGPRIWGDQWSWMPYKLIVHCRNRKLSFRESGIVVFITNNAHKFRNREKHYPISRHE